MWSNNYSYWKKLLNGNDIAEGFSIVLGKKIEYIPVELDTWTEKFISFIKEHRDSHTAIHLDTISRMVAGGFYDKDLTPTLREILGREPQDFYESLKKNPKVMNFTSSQWIYDSLKIKYYIKWKKKLGILNIKLNKKLDI